MLRRSGLLPPSSRKLLSEISNEQIKSITIVRTPLSSIVPLVANVVSKGEFQEKMKEAGYDNLFHLSLWINDKYNLEKNEVISLSISSPIKSNSETKTINIIPNNLTFQTLIDRTRKFMGDSKFSSYNFETNNCQDFLISVLNSNRIGNQSDRAFIKQDTDKVVQSIPTIAKLLANLATTGRAVLNRIQEGEGAYHHNHHQKQLVKF